MRCRKTYHFTFHADDDEPVRCFAPIPFVSLYCGVFFDGDMADEAMRAASGVAATTDDAEAQPSAAAAQGTHKHTDAQG